MTSRVMKSMSDIVSYYMFIVVGVTAGSNYGHYNNYTGRGRVQSAGDQWSDYVGGVPDAYWVIRDTRYGVETYHEKYFLGHPCVLYLGILTDYA